MAEETKDVSRFVWYELMAKDAGAAEAFYSKAIGWEMKDGGMETPYTMLMVGPAAVGGLMTMPPEVAAMGVPPHWAGYIGVGNAEAAQAKVLELGGMVLRPVAEIPTVGRFAVVADPQGAQFVLFEPKPSGEMPLPVMGAPGTPAWHELVTVDWEAGLSFYSSMFGWTKEHSYDMGGMGTYQMFATGGMPTGGMMNRFDPKQPPAWLYYFNVEEIHAAVARVKEHGGTVVTGPELVPTGQYISRCLDPQGAVFGMVGSAAQG